MDVFFDNESTPTIQMGVHLRNTFENGETFWGFTAGTGDKPNEQTICITEVEIGNETVCLLDPNNSFNCDEEIQELKCSVTVTNYTVDFPNIIDVGYCGTSPGLSGCLIYTISDVAGNVTLSTCLE